jgi:hypothetical protein
MKEIPNQFMSYMIENNIQPKYGAINSDTHFFLNILSN